MKRSWAVPESRAAVLAVLLGAFLVVVLGTGDLVAWAALAFVSLGGAAAEVIWPERPIRLTGRPVVAVVVRNGILGGLVAYVLVLSVGFLLRYAVHGAGVLPSGESFESYWIESGFWGTLFSPIAMLAGLVGAVAAHLVAHRAPTARPT